MKFRKALCLALAMRWLQWRLEADKEKNVLQALREMMNKEETLAHERAEQSERLRGTLCSSLDPANVSIY